MTSPKNTPHVLITNYFTDVALVVIKSKPPGRENRVGELPAQDHKPEDAAAGDARAAHRRPGRGAQLPEPERPGGAFSPNWLKI